MINKDRAKQVFLELVHINSVSCHERGVADYVKEKLASLGFEVEEDDAGAKIGGNSGNIIGYLPGNVKGAMPIFLCSHMDTVEPTEGINVIEDNGMIKTDGKSILGADDRAGITVIFEGITDILERNAPHGDIQVIFSISEEVGLRGARAIDPSKIRAKMGYVFDTGKPVTGIVTSAPSHERIVAEIRGKAAHAGVAPETGISAVVAACRAVAKMKLGRIDSETTANIGRIEGGKATNIVPDYAIVYAEARSRSNEKLDEQVKHMKTVFEEEAEKMGAKADVITERRYFAYHFSEDDEVIQLAARAVRNIGMKPMFYGVGGGSDANIFNQAGVPAAVLSVGYTGPHSVTECIHIDDLVKSCEFVASLISTAAETR